MKILIVNFSFPCDYMYYHLDSFPLLQMDFSVIQKYSETLW